MRSLNRKRSAAKEAYVCTACRLSFKDRGETPCPECGRALVCAGRDFKAPRRGDIRGWKRVAALLNAGHRFIGLRGIPKAHRARRATSPTRSAPEARRFLLAVRKRRLARLR